MFEVYSRVRVYGLGLPLPNVKRLPHPLMLNMSPILSGYWKEFQYQGGGEVLRSSGLGLTV